MKSRQRRVASAISGATLVLLLLAIVALNNRFQPPAPEVFELREVSMYTPPPPPPPQRRDEQSSTLAGSAINLARNTNIVSLDMLTLEVRLAAGGMGDLGSGAWGIGDGIGQGLQTFDLSELDSAPTVIGSPPIVYPSAAVDQGITEFVVQVHILIDEEGRTHLMRIVENPFPSFNIDLRQYVSGVVFTAPRRLGLTVRAEYLWPLRIRQPEDEL